MKKFLCLLTALLLTCLLAAAAAETAPESTGVVAKVTTKKGPLKLRAKGSEKSRTLAEIPNGTCLLVTEEDETWCKVTWNGRTGYSKTQYLTLLRNADQSILTYRVLREGDKGDDVLALKQRLQALGYIRGSSDLTNVYNDITAERLTLFQRQLGISEDGVASQELQAYLFSDKAPQCGQKLPKARSRVLTKEGKRMICGCCMGEGCECCKFKGWVEY